MGFLSFLWRKKKSNSSTPSTLSNNSNLSPPSLATKTGKEEFEEVFHKFDINGDGKISWVELGLIFSTLGYNSSSTEELQIMVKEVDSDGDGFISLNEFLELNRIDTEKQIKDIESAFTIVDSNGDGLISPLEVQKLMKSLGDEQSIPDCKKIIQSFDSNGDGLISLDEFKKMMLQGSEF
ncbi:hypothetical protein MKX01_018008 [Papaver californicum]|nr:hypothetical protein MKX01_018008 [Papaver californicum]